MKAKKVCSWVFAAAMTAAMMVSVSADTLTETSPSGQTEVTARIEAAAPGEVSYIITIPDVVDFGVLTQPADPDKDDYKDVPYTVTATKLDGLDPSKQEVSVYVRDQNATINGEQEFYIANKSDASKKFKYDVYTVPNIVNSSVSINDETMTSAAGYYLKGFTEEGESVEGTLRLNQNQLCQYQLADIVGEYSGYMVFFSMVDDIQ